MNLEETIALIECLKASGATHFKSRDFEVCLRRRKGVISAAVKPHKRIAPPPTIQEQAELPGVGNPVDTQKAKDLISALRDPEKLINTIFPDGAGG